MAGSEKCSCTQNLQHKKVMDHAGMGLHIHTSFLAMSFLLKTFRVWLVTFEAMAVPKPILFRGIEHQTKSSSEWK